MQVLEYKSSCTWFIHDTATNEFLLQLRDDKYKPYPNQWGFPGGGKEGTESPRETSYRELKEELNYHPAQMEEVLTLYHHSPQLAEHFYYIPLDVPRDKLELHEGREISFFSLDDISRMHLIWWSNEVVPILKRYISETFKK